MAAHFVDDPLDSVDPWSVLGLLKYPTQCSYWPKGWPNVKFPEDAAHAIRRKEGPQTLVASPVTVWVWSCCYGTSSTDYQDNHSFSNRLERARPFLVQGAKGGGWLC